jgi:hypothetical protein
VLGPSLRLARTPSCASGCCKRRGIGDKLSKESVRRREEKRKELRLGGISCPETSVRNYQHSLRNSPEGRNVVVSGVNADIA